MARWEPDTRERLQDAALDLFERGYDNTTAAQIAERAGTAKSTFFRHFPDKREVLFAGTGEIADRAAAAIAAAEPGATAFGLLDVTLSAIIAIFDPGKRLWYARRQAVVARNPELRERDLLKQAAQTEAMTEALYARGLAPLAADLTVTLIELAFHVTYTRWIEAPADGDIAAVAAAVRSELRSTVGALDRD